MLTNYYKRIYNLNNNFNFQSFLNKTLITYPYSKIQKQLQFTKAFSDAVTSKLQKKSNKSFLRLQIFAGQGCQGFTYKFKFDELLNQNDFVYEVKVKQNQTNQKQIQKIVFATNGEEMKLLKGATIDYAQQMMREIFYVKQNPNAEISCSCKSSFSPKDYVL